MSHSQASQFWIVGTPLSEAVALSEATIEVLSRCEVIVAESAKIARRWCSKHKVLADKSWFYLDGIRPDEEKQLVLELSRCKKSGTHVALFSDGGMPILFDPGESVLKIAKEQHFQIRTLPGPTSWATALAVSGWEPPFLIEGFPPRKTEEREAYLSKLSSRAEAIVFLDTPYRFELLLAQVQKCFAPTRAVFIAWEIGTDQEHYLWTSVGKAAAATQKLGMKKGEFVLILGSH